MGDAKAAGFDLPHARSPTGSCHHLRNLSVKKIMDWWAAAALALAAPWAHASLQTSAIDAAVTAVEFYNAALDHYFISTLAPAMAVARATG